MKVSRWVLCIAVLAAAGCASWNSESGVDNLWRGEDSSQWIAGKTTEADVTDALGPPSQMIALGDRTVFYYLREQKKGKGIILLVWNWGKNEAVYDRAIFFFDKQGRLIHHAYSPEALKHDAK